MQVTCSEDFIAARRTVIGESAHSDIGRLYFEVGPKVGEQRIVARLGKQIRAGRLRRTDTAVATRQLPLVEAEQLYPNLMGVRRGPRAPRSAASRSARWRCSCGRTGR